MRHMSYLHINRLARMDNQILKLTSEKHKLPIIGTKGVIKKLSSNSVGIGKCHFEQFITTQPGMTDLVNNICQSLTYNNAKSAKYVTKEFQVWISSSELFQLAHKADDVIVKVIVSIKDSFLRNRFVRVLNDIYKSNIGDSDANMLKFLVKILKDYREDVAKMASSFVLETWDEILLRYENYMMDLCFSFEIVALLVRFRFMKMGISVKDIQ
jgi:hypothetical protein